ncbi:hypothetical protein B9Z55_022910 [Caenorhabditis nigoni]|nr:hypothetical protein B9Z55_022910 [Caenorhabditis nigoni]
MDRLTSWEDAQFHPKILENLRAIKYTGVRTIQAAMIPQILAGYDETLATCHVNVAEKQSGKIDNTTSPMAQAPRISGPAQHRQADLSQQDARSQERLLEELSRQVTAIQETLAAYMTATVRTPILNKRKRSPSLEILTNDFDGVKDQRAPETLRGVNEIVAPTPERKIQLRQERMNLYNGEFEDTYLPCNHSINYKSWTRQQFEEFAVQLLPSEVVTALVN